MENFSLGRILSVLMLGAFISILNQTLLNVAIPHLMNDFNVSATTVQWLSTAYMLVNGVLIPITAYLINSFGTRFLFISAMVLFGAGSVICAGSPTFSIMLLGRIVQASGAGIIMPLVMNVFLTVFPPERRGAAMGTMGIAMMFAPAIGPTLSGWVVQNYTWRILFIMVIPLTLLDIVLALIWLRNVSKLSKSKFDTLGAMFSTIGFGSLLYGFSSAGSKGWDSAVVVITLVIGVLFTLFFVLRELSMKNPMLEFRVFKYDIFTISTFVGSAVNMAMFGAMLLLPIYLQNIRGFSPLDSGLLLLPGALLMGIMSPISGIIFDRIGARPLAIVGLTITAISTFEFSRLTGDTPYSHIMMLYTVRSFGMSLLMMSVQTEGLNQLPAHLGSHGTAMSNTVRQIAGSIGTALLVTIMTSKTKVHFAEYGNTLTTANPIAVDNMNGLGQSLSAMSGIPPATGQALGLQVISGLANKESTIRGINDAFVVATWFAVAGLLLSFFLRRAVRPKRMKIADTASPTEPQAQLPYRD
ncbi:EmrB/QacA subfamily drug resistance transporter [Paenibacillus shirakamiensis]|uniref:EmrB/QacA subfamily drug resistance transporter n=1 Tax=Paenibacillus shirakamiensis TaxID=1265935 RepID=A0ABS4JJM8_9BACL|nr:DHA2 family efflux MFS transporter permease subunit [Paenibacillus shirakamiensis]MBP2001909.1 EmrB/QacA subfamily drug resistance transporter [Paenibacillus shirakamiensis]